MQLFEIVALLITLAALFAYVNHRTIRLPTTIGVLLIAFAFSLALIGLDRAGLVGDDWMDWFREVEFAPALLQGMLGFLLFAGALHVDLGELLEQKWIVGLLATGGVLISTFLVGIATWLGADWVGLEIGLLYCLLFGALIAPTDPIAVLAVLKQAGVPPSVEMKIAGESLFNDGVGVVIFLVLLGTLGGAAGHGAELGAGSVLGLFVQEALGGILLGLVLGYVAYRMLSGVDNYQVELMVTLALVTGGYALASRLHLSGPLAMVAAGLLIGNPGRTFGMSARTREHLDTFWELVDEVLNAVLFLMIGLEVLVLTFTRGFLIAGLVGIPLVLGVRFLSVGLMVTLLRVRRSFSPHAVTMLTWGGLRGGISVALALSLPAGPERDLIVAATYVIVAFSILVQGLTIAPLARRLYGSS